MDKLKKILILAPHTDDGEFGCGATISRFIKEGKEIFYIAFSAPKINREGFKEDQLKIELMNACEIWGLDKKNVYILDYPVRNFNSYRQKILDQIIKFRDKIKPDMVFTPSEYDVHQDHKVIYNESIRAFKSDDVCILGYEMPWNNLKMRNNFFINITKKDIDKKLEVLKEYKSQMHRKYLNDEFLRGLAKVRGVQSGSEYAENFQIIKWVI